jgi:hypothetical protein
MTKPTGRPRGRPKSKEYVTLMARVDVALATQVKRYASLHRQPLSVVIRDALTLLMEEYPSGADLTGPHRIAAHEFLSDRYESPLDTLVGETDSAGLAELLSETNDFAIEKIMSDPNRGAGYMSDTNENDRIISDANRDTSKASDMNAGAYNVSDVNRDVDNPPYTSSDEEITSDTKAVHADIMSDTKEDDANYNPAIHSLGKLCPRQHEYRGTGQSVLRLSNRHCRACDREKFHERTQAKRQTIRA